MWGSCPDCHRPSCPGLHFLIGKKGVIISPLPTSLDPSGLQKRGGTLAECHGHSTHCEILGKASASISSSAKCGCFSRGGCETEGRPWVASPEHRPHCGGSVGEELS